MTDLIDEVSHDIQNEKYDRLVYRLSRVFIAVVIAILIGVVFYVWKENTSEKLQKELSIVFNKALAAVDNNELDQAVSFFDQIISHPSQQYAALAYINKAAVLLKQNKFDEAQKTLLETNEHKHFDLSLRELAQVTYLSNKLANNQIDDDKINQEIFDRLTKDKKPWKMLAQQVQALFLIRENKISEAKNILTQVIQNPDANKNSKDIAASILSSISDK